MEQEQNPPQTTSIQRAILAGVVGFVAMVTIGGVSVVLAKALTPPTKQRATIQSDGMQIVDKECADKLVELQHVYDTEERALEERKRTIESVKSRYTAQQGEAIQAPEGLADQYVSPGFEAAMKDISDGKRGVELVLSRCDIYPCIAVFQSGRNNLPSTLKSSLQSKGFTWTHRWVALGKSEHDQGATYFSAIRFHNPKGLDTKQARFLSEGLDDVLDQAMSQPMDVD